VSQELDIINQQQVNIDEPAAVRFTLPCSDRGVE
jgi:hypothetical protein